MILRERRAMVFVTSGWHGCRSWATAARCCAEGNSILTIRATARVKLANGQLSDMKRTVAAQVKYMPATFRQPDPHPALVRHDVEQLTRPWP